MHYKRLLKHGDPTKTAYARRDAVECSVAGCAKPVLARKMCSGHYQRWRSGAEIDGPLRTRYAPTEFEKVCSYCGQARPLADFSPNGGGRVSAWCKPCRRLGNKRREYGLTDDEYRSLIEAGCTVCGSTKKVCVDHSHTTGKVRSALCNNCNVALGLAGDDPARLRALANYLDSHA